MFGRLKRIGRILGESGVAGLAYETGLKLGVPLPLSTKSIWRVNLVHEVRWWDSFFQSEVVPKGTEYPRLQPCRPLQERVARLLPEGQETVRILDVGAGPLTFLGKTHPGRTISITAVDPLAGYYDQILTKYRITPPVRTIEAHAERLCARFPEDTFDLVFARNCIDHSYHPEEAILEMIKVVKPQGYVLMEHHPNEADNARYAGLHQWNLSMDDAGSFIIRSRRAKVNITSKYRHLCSIACEMIEDGEPWIITRIRKR